MNLGGFMRIALIDDVRNAWPWKLPGQKRNTDDVGLMTVCVSAHSGSGGRSAIGRWPWTQCITALDPSLSGSRLTEHTKSVAPFARKRLAGIENCSNIARWPQAACARASRTRTMRRPAPSPSRPSSQAPKAMMFSIRNSKMLSEVLKARKAVLPGERDDAARLLAELAAHLRDIVEIAFGMHIAHQAHGFGRARHFRRSCRCGGRRARSRRS